LRCLYLLLQFLAKALEGTALMVLRHTMRISQPETRLSERDVAEARDEMVETGFCAHVLNVSNPVFAFPLRHRLDRQGLLCGFVFESLVVFVRLHLEDELAKDRHHELLAFDLRELSLFVVYVRICYLTSLDDLIKIERPL
jgi:hypothetical protein